jgi:glycosyltransferase involved in cell wall biosynthesis
MEVLFDTSAVPPQPAGAGRYIADLARALAPRLGSHLTLLCGRGDGDRWATLAPGAVIAPRLPRQRALRLAAEQVAPALARPADGTLWHGPHYTLPLRYRRGPRVVTVHDLSFITHPEWHEGAKVAYFRRMIPAAARHADHVFCISARTREELLQRVDLDPARVSVTPLGLDESLFRGGTGAAATPVPRPSYAQVHGHTYVLVLGTAEPRKNLVRTIAAFDAIAAQYPNLRLAMVGQEGWKTAPVQAALAASPNRGRVVGLGYVPDEDLPGLLGGARALCYASLYEGFGLPVIEGLACGTPVVTSRDSVMAENAGDTAILVDPVDVASIAVGLRTALDLSDDDRAAHIGRGRARAAEFRWSRTAELTLAGYEQAREHWAATHG